MAIHVIIGAGAVGSGTARALAAKGHDVRLLTRTGSGPDLDGVQRIAVDATDAAELRRHAFGADAIYNCANPPYNRWVRDWPPLAASILAAAEASGARLVTMSNLYGYERGVQPMRETDVLAPPSRKGEVRAAMWAAALEAHEAGSARITEARASDFIGAGLGAAAHMGDRVVPRVLAGKSVSLIGDPDVAHSWTAIDDVTNTLAVLGTDARAEGAVWHVPTVPALSGRQLIQRMCELAGVEEVKVSGIPGIALLVAGIFSPAIREMKEVTYQFTEPFVVDSSATEATFGLSPTPLDVTLQGTIDAYRKEALSVS